MGLIIAIPMESIIQYRSSKQTNKQSTQPTTHRQSWSLSCGGSSLLEVVYSNILLSYNYVPTIYGNNPNYNLTYNLK